MQVHFEVPAFPIGLSIPRANFLTAFVKRLQKRSRNFYSSVIQRDQLSKSWGFLQSSWSQLMRA